MATTKPPSPFAHMFFRRESLRRLLEDFYSDAFHIEIIGPKGGEVTATIKRDVEYPHPPQMEYFTKGTERKLKNRVIRATVTTVITYEYTMSEKEEEMVKYSRETLTEKNPTLIDKEKFMIDIVDRLGD